MQSHRRSRLPLQMLLELGCGRKELSYCRLLLYAQSIRRRWIQSNFGVRRTTKRIYFSYQIIQ